MITREQVNRLKKSLVEDGIRDIDLKEVYEVQGSDEIPILQNGKNVRVSTDALLKASNASFISIPVTNITLEQAINYVLPRDMKIGLVISYLDIITKEWEVAQFKGTDLSKFGDPKLWYILNMQGGPFKGLFNDEQDLIIANPVVKKGDYAYIGKHINTALIYQVNDLNHWYSTGKTVEDNASKFDVLYFTETNDNIAEVSNLTERAIADEEGRRIIDTYVSKCEVEELVNSKRDTLLYNILNSPESDLLKSFSYMLEGYLKKYNISIKGEPGPKGDPGPKGEPGKDFVSDQAFYDIVKSLVVDYIEHHPAKNGIDGKNAPIPEFYKRNNKLYWCYAGQSKDADISRLIFDFNTIPQTSDDQGTTSKKYEIDFDLINIPENLIEPTITDNPNQYPIDIRGLINGNSILIHNNVSDARGCLWTDTKAITGNDTPFLIYVKNSTPGEKGLLKIHRNGILVLSKEVDLSKHIVNEFDMRRFIDLESEFTFTIGNSNPLVVKIEPFNVI